MLLSASNRLLGPGNGWSCSVFNAVLERCNTKKSLRHTAMQEVQENFGCMSWPHEPIQLRQDSKEFHATIHTHMTFCFLEDSGISDVLSPQSKHLVRYRAPGGILFGQRRRNAKTDLLTSEALAASIGQPNESVLELNSENPRTV